MWFDWVSVWEWPIPMDHNLLKVHMIPSSIPQWNITIQNIKNSQKENESENEHEHELSHSIVIINKSKSVKIIANLINYILFKRQYR